MLALIPATMIIAFFMFVLPKWINIGSHIIQDHMRSNLPESNKRNFNTVQIEQENDEVQNKPKVTSFKELYDYEHEEFKLNK